MSQEKKPCSPSSGGGASPAASGVTPCGAPEDPCGKDAISNVTKCCGTEVLEEAKKGNGGKEPEIVFGTPGSIPGGLAETDNATGKITILSTAPLCQATENLYFELNNVATLPQLNQNETDAANGKLTREEYVKAKEKIEYGNVRKTLAALDKCKKKWGCDSYPSGFEVYRPAKDFDDYYNNYLKKLYPDHPKSYGDFWDKYYKAAYDAKHPAPKK